VSKIQDQIVQAVKTLRKGGVVLIPTETVYGLAVDASNSSAVKRLYEIKKRDHSKPLQIMVPSLSDARKMAIFSGKALELAKKFWPGALTMVLKLRPEALKTESNPAPQQDKFDPRISPEINKLNDTVGIRIPDHPIALEILRQVDFPLAVTSANISGDESTVSYAEAEKILGNKLDFLIDGGESRIGISSTVIDASVDNEINIIREGSIKL
jgi:L-threonylcarbamoyladenylate synthase